MRSRCMVLIPVLMLVCHGTAQAQTSSSEVDIRAPLEVPEDAPGTPYAKGSTVRVETHVVRGGFVSVQVNVDEGGANFVGDAANEPSIAVDPTAPNRIVIGWRQFDTIVSNFRQAGWGYSNDGGRSWSFPGVINPGVFRSDPVLEVSPEGSFYYYSLRGDLYCQLFISEDSGQSWSSPIPAFGGDKAWVVVDRTGGIGHGNLYVSWSLAENPWGDPRSGADLGDPCGRGRR
jgi:hypothetical protein